MSEFRQATSADDELLRRLLRENSMPSWVDMRLEREPSFFAYDKIYGDNWAVVAEEDGRPFGMYTAAVVPVYVNGQACCGGYLGGLRVQYNQRKRIRHLREGYASIRSLAPVLPDWPWWFSVIATENSSARRLLEAGLSGLPHYRSLGTLTTYAIAAARAKPQGLWRQATTQEVPSMLTFHAAQASRYQFAPVLSAALLERIGLESFWLYSEHDRIVAMAAWWDQRAFRQVVAQSYHNVLQWTLPLYNGLARLIRGVPLPRPGQALDQTYLAFVAFDPILMPQYVRTRLLLRDLLSHCPTSVAVIGLGDRNPLQPILGSFRPLVYRTTVYAVEFDKAAALDQRPIQPEVALL